jgi:NAD-dependent deacetylase
VAEARQQGALTIEVNLEPSANSEAFDAALYGPAGEILPPLVDAIMAGLSE